MTETCWRCLREILRWSAAALKDLWPTSHCCPSVQLWAPALLRPTGFSWRRAAGEPSSGPAELSTPKQDKSAQATACQSAASARTHVSEGNITSWLLPAPTGWSVNESKRHFVVNHCHALGQMSASWFWDNVMISVQKSNVLLFYITLYKRWL